MTHGPLIILSGPSGSGKSTVIDRVRAETAVPLHLSVSATTRGRREYEVDGVHYHFWTPERFLAGVEAGEFLEWAEVHGRYYGTLKREVLPYREQSKGVILVIDVQGAARVRAACPDAVSVFLRASSLEEYARRLHSRGTEDEAAVLRRLENARKELERAGEYTTQVVNDDLGTAVAQLRGIIESSFPRG